MSANSTVQVTFVAKDLLTAPVRGIKNTITNFKRDAMSGFGMSAGLAFGQIASTAFGMVIDGAQGALRAQRDLTEQQTKSLAVFKDSSGVVSAFAKTAARSYGLSERAALEATGTIGNLLEAVGQTPAKAAEMSTSLVKLAADLASFNNRDVKEVTTALHAGLVGEAEPARRLGINISMLRVENYLLTQGIVKQKSQITDSMKVMARYNIMMIDAANAHGDFARTSHNLANQQRIFDAQIENLGANLGKLLVGPANNFLRFLNNMADEMTGQSKDAVKEFIKQLGYLGAALDDTSGIDSWSFAIRKAYNDLLLVRDFTTDWAGNKTLDEIFGNITPELIAMAEQAGMSTVFLRELATQLKDAGGDTNDLYLALRLYIDQNSRATTLTGGWSVAMARAAVSTEELKSGVSGLSREVEIVTTAYENFKPSKDFTQLEPKEMFKGMMEQIKKFKEEVKWLEKHPKFMDKVGRAYAKLVESPAFKKLEEGQGALGKALTSNIKNWGVEIIGTIEGGMEDSWLFPVSDALGKRMGWRAGTKAGEQLFAGIAQTAVGSEFVLVLRKKGQGRPGGGTAPGATPVVSTDSSKTTNSPAEDNAGMGGGGVFGGAMSPYKTYLVGERGPEFLTMGAQRGYLSPNGSGSGDITVNIDGERLFKIVNRRLGRAVAMGA